MMIPIRTRLLARLTPRRPATAVASCRWNSTIASTVTTDNNDKAHPELKHCPALPFLGSTVPAYSKAPAMKPTEMYDFWPAMTRQFGEFYTYGMPGIGAGINQTVYIIQDPYEMMKVLKSEGKFPSGAAQSAWGIRKIMEDLGNAAGAAILDQGPKWKRVRTFFQTDLLSPQKARQYVPAISEATRYASQGVVKYDSNDLNTFMEDASFDMFASLSLGTHTRITDPNFEADPQDVRFCRLVKQGLTGNTVLTQDVKEMLLGKVLGLKTVKYKEVEKIWIEAFAIANEKINFFLERRQNGTQTEMERNSYLQQALDRSEDENGKSDVTVEECCELVKGLLGASVDTTAGMTSWHLLHISMHPETQERIYDELTNALESNGGILTADAVSAKSAPYLHAAFRESHRLNNPSPMVPMKRIQDDINIHGVDVPAGNVIVFDGISKSYNLVDDPDRYDPDRWMPEAVEARKGTPAAVLDHVLFKEPFSEGARRCPGSRVAKNESLLLMAQLILDWKMENSVKHWRDIKYRMDTVLTPQLPPIQFIPR